MVLLGSWVALCVATAAGLATPHIAAYVRNQRALREAGAISW